MRLIACSSLDVALRCVLGTYGTTIRSESGGTSDVMFLGLLGKRYSISFATSCTIDACAIYITHVVHDSGVNKEVCARRQGIQFDSGGM